MAKSKDVPAPPATPQGYPTDNQLERLFDDFFSRRWLRPWTRDWAGFESRLDTATPRVDVVDREHDVLVRAELPGMTREDIEVTVGDDSITVRGRTRHEETREDGDYHRHEIVSNAVSRTVSLPCEVDGDHARAQLKDGMLEVTVPKAERAKRRRVQVES